MGLYRVREGARLPHIGRIYEPGELVELPAWLAAEPAVACCVDAVPDEPKEPDVVPLDDPTVPESLVPIPMEHVIAGMQRTEPIDQPDAPEEPQPPTVGDGPETTEE